MSRNGNERALSIPLVKLYLERVGYFGNESHYLDSYPQQVERLYYRFNQWKRHQNSLKERRPEYVIPPVPDEYKLFVGDIVEVSHREASQRVIEPTVVDVPLPSVDTLAIAPEEQVPQQVTENDPAYLLAAARSVNDIRFAGDFIHMVQINHPRLNESQREKNRFRSGRSSGTEVLYYNGCSYAVNVIDRMGFVKRLGEPIHFSGSPLANGVTDKSLLNTALSSNTMEDWDYQGRGLYIKVHQTMHMESLYQMYRYYRQAKDAGKLKDSRVLTDIANIIVGDSRHGNVQDFVSRNHLFDASRSNSLPYHLEIMYFLPESELDKLHTYYENTLDITVTKSEYLSTYSWHPNQGNAMKSVFWKQANVAAEHYQKFHHHVAYLHPEDDDVYLRVSEQGSMPIERETILEGPSYVEINIAHQLEKPDGSKVDGSARIYLNEPDAMQKLASYGLYLSLEASYAPNDAKVINRLNGEIEELKRRLEEQNRIFKLKEEEYKAEINNKVREHKERIAEMEHRDKQAQVIDNASEREFRKEDVAVKRKEIKESKKEKKRDRVFAEVKRMHEENKQAREMEYQKEQRDRDRQAQLIESQHKASIRESDNTAKNIAVGGAAIGAAAGIVVAASKISSAKSSNVVAARVAPKASGMVFGYAKSAILTTENKIAYAKFEGACKALKFEPELVKQMLANAIKKYGPSKLAATLNGYTAAFTKAVSAGITGAKSLLAWLTGTTAATAVATTGTAAAGIASTGIAAGVVAKGAALAKGAAAVGAAAASAVVSTPIAVGAAVVVGAAALISWLF